MKYLILLIIASALLSSPLEASPIKKVVSHVPLEIISLKSLKIKEQKINKQDPAMSYVIVEIKGTYESNGMDSKTLGLEFIPNEENYSLEKQTFLIQLREISNHYPELAIPSSIVMGISSPKAFSFKFKIQPMGMPYGWQELTWRFDMNFIKNHEDVTATLEAKLLNSAGGPEWRFSDENFLETVN